MSRQICKILKDGKETGAIIVLDDTNSMIGRSMTFLNPGKYELIAGEIEK